MSEGDSSERTTSQHSGSQRRIWALGLVAGIALGVALVAWTQRSDDGAVEAVTVPTLGAPVGALPGTPAPGDPNDPAAPDFIVPTAAGGSFHLAEHLATDGRPVLLNLWASWCIPCRKEMPALDAGQAAHPNVYFIGVAVQDSRADALGFVDEVGVTYAIGLDDDSVVEDAYSPLGMPETYLISADGLIVRRLFGEMTPDRIDAELLAAFGS